MPRPRSVWDKAAERSPRPGNRGTRAVRAQARSPGPAGRRRPPQPPGPAGPAPARVPALLGLGPWRLQPQRARLVGVESASGRFLHGPPLGRRPGCGPPPLSGWPRRTVRLRHRRRRWIQLREVEEAAAPLGRDHLGRKPRRAEISRGGVGNGSAREGGAGAGPKGQWAGRGRRLERAVPRTGAQPRCASHWTYLPLWTVKLEAHRSLGTTETTSLTQTTS